LIVRLIREDPERLRSGLARKRSTVDVERLVALDREALKISSSPNCSSRSATRAPRTSAVARRGGGHHRAVGGDEEPSATIKDLETRNKEIEETLDSLLLTVPNLPHTSVPDGADAAPTSWCAAGHAAQPFDDVLAALGNRREARHSRPRSGAACLGRGFIVFRGDGARLCRALINMMLDMHAEQGYEEVLVPYLVSRASMTGTGQLPKFEVDMYRCNEDDLFLIPTAEVPVTNLLRESVVERDVLPVKYTRTARASAAKRDRTAPTRAALARAPVRQGRDGEVRSSRFFL
jgi:seryl-tRNA synthetase